MHGQMHGADARADACRNAESYHAIYHHCTARYLQQAGTKTDFVRLADHGIRGNGHMMMLEGNNLEIAAFLDAWLGANVA